MKIGDKIPSWSLLTQPEKYAKAVTHATSEAFLARQKARIAVMQQNENVAAMRPASFATKRSNR